MLTAAEYTTKEEISQPWQWRHYSVKYHNVKTICISLKLPQTLALFQIHSAQNLQTPVSRIFFVVRSVATTTETVAGFDEMVPAEIFYLWWERRCWKNKLCCISCCKIRKSGHPTIVVSTDPAYSLSDSFDQDLTGGTLAPVQGADSLLFALEINPERTKEEFRAASQINDGTGVNNFMDSMGLGMLAEQLGELKLGEFLDTPPPGLDEAIAISKVVQFLESKEYGSFTQLVFEELQQFLG